MVNGQGQQDFPTGGPPTTVLVVAEVRLYREGLTGVLEASPRLRVLDAVADVEAAAPSISSHRPDVVLLDMTSAHALDATWAFAERFPEVRVVALGVSDVENELLACAEAGVAGYVLREASVKELVAAVESASRNELRCSPRVAAMLLRRVSALASEQRPELEPGTLTKRELEVLELVEEGLTNKKIASRLYIQPATVKNHVHSIIEKLGVRTRGEAAAKVRRSRRRKSRMSRLRASASD